MWAQLHGVALVAADSPGPRGDNPSDLGGILIVVGIMVLLVAAALVYVIDIQRATGGKTMAELRTERQVLDSPSQPS